MKTSVAVCVVVAAALVAHASAYRQSNWGSPSDGINMMNDFDEFEMDAMDAYDQVDPSNGWPNLQNIKIDFGSRERCKYPGGNCYQLRLQKVQGCTDHYSIHGLWPQWAKDCGGNPQKVFKDDFKSAFQKTMVTEWPTCKGTNHEWFWSHEWRKHGTCAKAFGSMVNYFETAVRLAKTFRHLCDRPDADGLFRKVHSHNRHAQECGICFNRQMTKIIDCV